MIQIVRYIMLCLFGFGFVIILLATSAAMFILAIPLLDLFLAVVYRQTQSA